RHGGRVPAWLAERMTKLGTAISESIRHHYGAQELLSRLSDPFWFQALGSVMGMDWHSSGITTSVLGALKRGLNPRAHELGIYVCGGRGKHWRTTPDELRAVAGRRGLEGEARRLSMPRHHDVRAEDVDLKRLGAILAVAYEREFRDFASLLLLENLGPRTLQSLALIAEVVHGAPSRFSDPARFSFALGGKDRHPFPVPLKTYDDSISVLRRALDAAKLGDT